MRRINGSLVTGYADGCAGGSRHWMGLVTQLLNYTQHRLNLVVGRVGFHDDQHVFFYTSGASKGQFKPGTFAGWERWLAPAQPAMPLNIESTFHAERNLQLERGQATLPNLQI
jgi:hypothetical protein